MIQKMLITGLSTLLLSAVSYAQINFNSLYSRFVRVSGSVTTRIDTVETRTVVNNGNAVTKLSFVYTPTGTTYIKDSIPRIRQDSIETTLSFNLPAEFAVDSMWLWINGERIEAKIQDRALATAQYQQIVGYRLDPALLQYSGNGYYNLRVFPAFTNVSRRIELQFHHTFDEAVSNKVSAAIPINFDSLGSSYIYKQINVAKASFSTLDNAEYTINFPGIGSGSFSKGTSLVILTNNVNKIAPGVISRDDPSGSNEHLWIAKDAVRQKISAGINVQIADTNVTFDKEPQTRIIAIDIKNNLWNWNNYYKSRADFLGQTYTTNSYYKDIDILNRMQKYVLLCLEHYLGSTDKFNIVFGGKTVTTLFDQPMQANPEYIKQAMEAILKFTPDTGSTTEKVVAEAVKQASSDVIILISDMFEPIDYYTYDKSVYTVTNNGKLYNETFDKIAEIVDSSEVTLFTIDDNYRLSQISYTSGGFRLGSLLNIYNIEYKFEVVDGRRVKIPMMPPLFGSRNSSGIRAIKITSDKLQNIVYTVDGYSYVWLSDVTDMRMAAVPYYYTYNQTNSQIHIAGQANTALDDKVTFTVRGKLGGLKFSKVFVASTDQYSPGVQGSVQWAFRYAEEMAALNFTKFANDIKNIGIQYHLMTRQTSLLALEPGIEMWKDTLYSPQQVTSLDEVPSTVRGASEMADVSYAKSNGAPTVASGSGMDIDGISLTDLVSRNGITDISSPNSMSTPTFRGISAFYKNGAIRISGADIKERIVLQLLDLKGRIVVQKILSKNDLTGPTFNWSLDLKSSGISSGFYMLHITGNATNQVLRLPISSR
jgi:hypothetical protein